MPRHDALASPRDAVATSTIRWALAAFAVGLLIAAAVMP